MKSVTDDRKMKSVTDDRKMNYYIREELHILVYCGLLDCNALWTCRWISTFQRNILPPSSSMLQYLIK
jgi:hypothetical protein